MVPGGFRVGSGWFRQVPGGSGWVPGGSGRFREVPAGSGWVPRFTYTLSKTTLGCDSRLTRTSS